MEVSLVTVKNTGFTDVPLGSETYITFQYFKAFYFFMNVPAEYPKELHPYLFSSV